MEHPKLVALGQFKLSSLIVTFSVVEQKPSLEFSPKGMQVVPSAQPPEGVSKTQEIWQ